MSEKILNTCPAASRRPKQSWLGGYRGSFLAIPVVMAIAASVLQAQSAEAQRLRPVGSFSTNGDYVHVTAGDASAHGWWTWHSGPAELATVSIKLQTKTIRRFWFDSWSDTTEWTAKDLKPANNRSRNRVNVRKLCNGVTATWWRSIVDVDIIGYPDPPDKIKTRAVMRDCGV